MKTISITTQKGGVGKSTVAASLAVALAGRHRVLLIDMDQQGDSTKQVGAEKTDDTARLLYDGVPAADCISDTDTEGLKIIAGGPALTSADLNLTGKKLYILRDALKPVSDRFDYCIIDTPPSVGSLVLSALTASDYTLPVLRPQKSAVDGLMGIRTAVKTVQQKTNSSLKVAGIICNEWSKRPSRIQKDIDLALQDIIAPAFHCQVLPVLHTYAAYNNAESALQTVLDYRPNSTPAEEVRALALAVEQATGEGGQV